MQITYLRISPWAIIGRFAPPSTLHERQHFVQGTSGNDVSDVIRKKLDEILSFFKMPAMKIYLDNIPSSNCHKIIILVSAPTFSGSLIKLLCYSYSYSELRKIQDGRQRKSFFDKIKMSILKTELYLLALYKKIC